MHFSFEYFLFAVKLNKEKKETTQPKGNRYVNDAIKLPHKKNVKIMYYDINFWITFN